MAWPPSTETRSLSATGMPSSGWSAGQGRRALRARGGEPGVGRVGLAERALAVDRQPGVEGPVLALGGGEVRLGRELARATARRRAGGRPSRGRAAGSGRSSVAVGIGAGQRHSAEDRRHDDEVAVALPARSPGPPRPAATARTTSSRRMFSSSIVWAVGGMRVGVELGEHGVLVEDVVELRLRAASSSSSVRPRRARWATCSTSSRVRVAMAR